MTSTSEARSHKTVVVTREPEHPGYDELLDADGYGDDFRLLVDGETIGGTYHCPPGPNIRAGMQWASYGPAGYSLGHRTREDAEQVQLKAAGIVTASVITADGPAAPASEPGLPADAYDKALARAAKVGYKNANDAELMAGLCDGVVQMLAGAVAPRLVWEGAQKKGLTSKELLNLCRTDPMAVEALMWL
ncbi:hypothetical protein [Streptomyces geranii]|uniref:hypothetical protein n=1 Tax=Streptomyces geranii TaxID=2058923 RepID=UPI000D02DCDB|nr:hypothetical protein [Streptomyces geranii]